MKIFLYDKYSLDINKNPLCIGGFELTSFYDNAQLCEIIDNFLTNTFTITEKKNIETMIEKFNQFPLETLIKLNEDDLQSFKELKDDNETFSREISNCISLKENYMKVLGELTRKLRNFNQDDEGIEEKTEQIKELKAESKKKEEAYHRIIEQIIKNKQLEKETVKLIIENENMTAKLQWITGETEKKKKELIEAENIVEILEKRNQEEKKIIQNYLYQKK